MFVFFCNLFLALFNGSWTDFTYSQIMQNGNDSCVIWLNYLGNLFNESGNNFISFERWSNFAYFVSYPVAIVLSLICCISVFFIIVKSIRKIFSCFLEWF